MLGLAAGAAGEADATDGVAAGGAGADTEVCIAGAIEGVAVC